MKKMIKGFLGSAVLFGAMASMILIPSQAMAAEGSFPVTVTDQLGREVTIEEEPKTLVSGYYISTSALIALGQEDKLVGVEAKADTRPIYSLSAPDILELPSVGTAKEFDLEGCAALEPDLVILPAKLKDVIPSLEELGMTVIAVKPEDGELLEEMITILGDATGCGDTAENLKADIDQGFSFLADKLGDADTPSVYLAGNSSLLSTAGQEMYQNSLIANARGANVAAEITDTYWMEISYEQLIAWNPDYIILAADADYTVDSVLEDENLGDVTAVKNKNVYQIPSQTEAWDSPVPGSVCGSWWLASVLHPDKVTEDEWKEETTSLYEKYYAFTSEF